MEGHCLIILLFLWVQIKSVKGIAVVKLHQTVVEVLQQTPNTLGSMSVLVLNLTIYCDLFVAASLLSVGKRTVLFHLIWNKVRKKKHYRLC